MATVGWGKMRVYVCEGVREAQQRLGMVHEGGIRRIGEGTWEYMRMRGKCEDQGVRKWPTQCKCRGAGRR